MSTNFLNMDDNDESPSVDIKIGARLKNKSKPDRTRADTDAVAKAGEAHGFTRSTETVSKSNTPRRGRPPLNEDMTYWRIYLSSHLRNELNELRDKEGRRLNDLLEDMLAAYVEANK